MVTRAKHARNIDSQECSPSTHNGIRRSKGSEALDDYRQMLEELHEQGEPYGLIYLVIEEIAGQEGVFDPETEEGVLDVACARLKRCVRGSDDAVSIAKATYAVIIHNTYDADIYRNLQERIRRTMEDEIVLDDKPVRIHVRFGYARYPEEGETCDAIIEAARASMMRSERSRERLAKTERAIDVSEAIAALDDDRPRVDSLTGLPDATHFREKSAAIIDSEGAQGKEMAIVFCDVEKFKEYNLKYGYGSGDDLLKFIADTLEDTFPDSLIARLNSDRFGILTTTDDLVGKIERIHDLVRGFRINSSIELKAGICAIDGKVAGSTEAEDYARLACDSIKGRYDVFWRTFDEALAREVERRQHIIDNLDTAINSGWIEVYYQPVIRTLTGKVCGLEALTRWNDPVFGMLPPGEFIDVLEDSHLIHKLDIHMVKRVCEEGRRIMETGHAMVPTSVNLSRLDYQLCDIFSIVDDIVTKSGFPRDLLRIEITESAFTSDSEYFMTVVDRFRSAGYQMWMDDFGSGYSSLNLLKDCEVDVLKMDMLFLRGLETNPRTRDIIASVVDMAKKLGIQTLAEGVETEEHFAFLKSIGCEKAQGYLFCKPAPIAELVEKVAHGELSVEDMQAAGYYDTLGRVNMLSPAPFEHHEADDLEFSSGIPIGIIEYADKELRVLLSNDTFDEFVEDSGVARNVDSLIVFDKQGRRIADEFVKLEKVARESNVEENIDFYDFKDFYTLRLLHLGDQDDRHAYLASFSKYDMSAKEQEAYKPSTNNMVYLPQLQVTPWQTSDEIDFAHTAVIVIDVLGGSEGITPGLEDMAANCVALVKAARAKGIPIIFNSDSHIRGLDRELELWGEHGIRGEQNGEPLVEFEVAETDFIIPKRRYNGFFETDLELTLRELGATTLIVVGADTNICVLQTLAGAYFYGYKTIVPADATGTFLIGTQEAGLEYFQRCYDTRIVTTASLIDRIDAFDAS